jgi:hypothetical protein
VQPAVVETGIALNRARDYFGVARHLRILIDGRDVADVGYGGRVEVGLEPGTYSVQVAMDWCRSPPCEVQVHQDELVELEGGLRRRGLAWCWSLLAVFIAPGRVLVVQSLNEQLPRGRWQSVGEGIGVLVGCGLSLYLMFRLLNWLVG